MGETIMDVEEIIQAIRNLIKSKELELEESRKQVYTLKQALHQERQQNMALEKKNKPKPTPSKQKV